MEEVWEGEKVMVCTKTFSVLTKCTATMHG